MTSNTEFCSVRNPGNLQIGSRVSDPSSSAGLNLNLDVLDVTVSEHGCWQGCWQVVDSYPWALFLQLLPAIGPESL